MRAGLHSPVANNIRVRIISSIALMALALGCLFLGKRAIEILTAVLGGLMCWEWARQTVGGPNRGWGIGLFAGVFLTASVLSAVYTSDWLGCAVALLVSFAFILGATFLPGFKGRRVELLLGILYITGAGIAMVWMRGLEPRGAAIILWLFAIAWSGDTAAFVLGRSLGRHVLWRFRNKTWEGFAGGAMVASLVGFAAAPSLSWTFAERLVASAGLALAGQVGDLLESAAKRRLGVKNMSNLVPGHGGVLDRLDSLLLILLIAGAGYALARIWAAS